VPTNFGYFSCRHSEHQLLHGTVYVSLPALHFNMEKPSYATDPGGKDSGVEPMCYS